MHEPAQISSRRTPTVAGSLIFVNTYWYPRQGMGAHMRSAWIYMRMKHNSAPIMYQARVPDASRVLACLCTCMQTPTACYAAWHVVPRHHELTLNSAKHITMHGATGSRHCAHKTLSDSAILKPETNARPLHLQMGKLLFAYLLLFPSAWQRFACIYIYMYMHMHICICICTYRYVHTKV